jgi:class 3 adenylate cyclase
LSHYFGWDWTGITADRSPVDEFHKHHSEPTKHQKRPNATRGVPSNRSTLTPFYVSELWRHQYNPSVRAAPDQKPAPFEQPRPARSARIVVPDVAVPAAFAKADCIKFTGIHVRAIVYWSDFELEELLAKLPTGQSVLALDQTELDGIVLSCLIERCDGKKAPLPGSQYFSIDELNNLYPVGINLPYETRERAINRLYGSFGRLKTAGAIGPARDQYGLMTVTEEGKKGPAADRSALMSCTGGDRAMLAVVFTDIVGSTAMGRNLGDELMSEVRFAHFRRGELLIHQYGGYKIKNKGDGLMAAFRSVGAALDFALAFRADPGHSELQADGIRVGIHTGQVVVEGNDLFGQEVDFAARVEEATGGSGISLSDRAKSDLEGARPARHGNLQWQLHNENLKGIGPSRLWLLDSDELAPAAPPADGHKTAEDERKNAVTRAAGQEVARMKRSACKWREVLPGGPQYVKYAKDQLKITSGPILRGERDDVNLLNSEVQDTLNGLSGAVDTYNIHIDACTMGGEGPLLTSDTFAMLDALIEAAERAEAALN